MRYIILIFLLCSCSPQKRIDRIVSKNPELLTKDTITIRDTIITKSVSTDTIFNINFDTINIEKEKLKVRLIRINDTIQVFAECKEDTIFYEKVIEVDKIQVNEKNNYWIWLILLIIILLIVKYLKK